MKTDFYLSSSLKIAVIIFIPLAILLSLFPPYYWGNEKIRTLSERIRSDIAEQLPIKSYSFIRGIDRPKF